MTRNVSSTVANAALAVGVTLAVAVAVGFALTGGPSSMAEVAAGAAPVASTSMPLHGAATVARAQASGPAVPVAVAKATGPTMPSPKPVVRVAEAPAPRPAAPAVFEPYEPPAPPIAAVESASQVASVAPSALGSGPEQLAALSDVGLFPSPPSTAARGRQSGDALPGLRRVALDGSHEIQRAPDPVAIASGEAYLDQAGGRLVVPRRPDRVSARVPATHRGDGATHPAVYGPLAAQGGPNITGSAVVTAALELNVDGRPLRLYGLKLPTASDRCAPSPAYAARACADVSRQALAALIGDNSRISCRILARGGRTALPAICADAAGADIGTYLVTHGFALADRNDILDYSAAEQQAHAQGTGLWAYR